MDHQKETMYVHVPVGALVEMYTNLIDVCLPYHLYSVTDHQMEQWE